MDKFYVLDGIFEEIGLVLIPDFFPFEDFLKNLEFIHAKFLLCYRDFVNVNQTLKLKRNAKFGYF